MKKCVLTCLFILALPIVGSAQESVTGDTSEPIGLRVIDPEFIDPAFDRFVDLEMLADAWVFLDARVLADCGFQLAEGERILMRPHRKLTAQAVLEMAMIIAADQHDTETLNRIAAYATSKNEVELAAKVASAKKLAGIERSAGPTLMVDAFTSPLSKILICKEIVTMTDKARLVGDKEFLESLIAAVPESDELKEVFSESEIQNLKVYVETALQNVAQLETKEAVTTEALDKLAGESRHDGHHGGGNHGGGNHGGTFGGGHSGGYGGGHTHGGQQIKPGEAAAMIGIAIGAAALREMANRHNQQHNNGHYPYDPHMRRRPGGYNPGPYNPGGHQHGGYGGGHSGHVH